MIHGHHCGCFCEQPPWRRAIIFFPGAEENLLICVHSLFWEDCRAVFPGFKIEKEKRRKRRGGEWRGEEERRPRGTSCLGRNLKIYSFFE